MKDLQEKKTINGLKQVTVDVETDWGGRTNGTDGIEKGIPYILGILKQFNIQSIFFLSTKYLMSYISLAKEMQNQGHTIGSHGYEHKKFRNWLDWRLDYLKSMQILEKELGLRRPIPYRAPKFSYTHPEHRYSDRKGHTSLLRHVWFKEPLREILYCHPFDFVKPMTKRPSIYCSILYSRHKECRKRFEEIVRSVAEESSRT